MGQVLQAAVRHWVQPNPNTNLNKFSYCPFSNGRRLGWGFK